MNLRNVEVFTNSLGKEDWFVFVEAFKRSLETFEGVTGMYLKLCVIDEVDN